MHTHFWIDRTTGINGGIYSQFLPFVTPEAMAMYQDFETAVYTMLHARATIAWLGCYGARAENPVVPTPG